LIFNLQYFFTSTVPPFAPDHDHSPRNLLKSGKLLIRKNRATVPEGKRELVMPWLVRVTWCVPWLCQGGSPCWTAEVAVVETINSIASGYLPADRATVDRIVCKISDSPQW